MFLVAFLFLLCFKLKIFLSAEKFLKWIPAWKEKIYLENLLQERLPLWM